MRTRSIGVYLRVALLRNLPFLAFLAVWLAFSLWEHRTNARIYLFETGGYLAGGRRILHGQVPYRDYFLLHAPARYYYGAAVLALARNGVDAGWLFHTALNIVDSGLAYALGCRLIKSRALRLLPALAAFSWSSSSERMLMPLLAMLLLVHAIETRDKRWALAAGVAVGLSLFVLQDLAPALIAAATVWLGALAWVRRSVPALREALPPIPDIGLRLAVGIVLGIAPPLILLAAAGAFAPFWRDVIVMPMRSYAGQHYADFPSLWRFPDGSHGPGGLVRWVLYTLPFYFVPAVCLAGLLDAVRRLRSSAPVVPEAARALIALVGLFLYRSVWIVRDLPHLQANALPAAILLPVFLDRWLIGSEPGRPAVQRVAKAGAAVSALAICLFMVYPFLHAGYHRGMASPVPFGLHASTTLPEWPDAWQAALFLRAHTGPDEPVLCIPQCPLLYVLADRDNAGRYDYFDPIITPAIEADALRELEQAAPRFCVVQRNNLVWNKVFGRDYGQSLQLWIDSHYRTVMESRYFLVLERAPGRSPDPSHESPRAL